MVRRFQIEAGTNLIVPIDGLSGPVLSPDGKRIAYVHQEKLWVRELANTRATNAPRHRVGGATVLVARERLGRLLRGSEIPGGRCAESPGAGRTRHFPRPIARFDCLWCDLEKRRGHRCRQHDGRVDDVEEPSLRDGLGERAGLGLRRGELARGRYGHGVPPAAPGRRDAPGRRSDRGRSMVHRRAQARRSVRAPASSTRNTGVSRLLARRIRRLSARTGDPEWSARERRDLGVPLRS